MLVQRRVLVHRVVRHDAPQLTPGVDDGQAAPLTPPSQTVREDFKQNRWCGGSGSVCALFASPKIMLVHTVYLPLLFKISHLIREIMMKTDFPITE